MGHHALPGNRDFSLPREAPPAPLDRVLRALLAPASWNRVRDLVRSGKVLVCGEIVLDPSTRVGGGALIAVRPSAPRARAAPRLSPSVIAHLDAHVVVVKKPSGISTVAWDDEAGTLDQLLRRLVEQQTGRRSPPLVVVHRLDKETSGVLVFARTKEAAQGLRSQFRGHHVERRYLAIAHGEVRSGTHRSRLVADRGDGRRGSTRDDRLGREAVTHVRVVERLREASLVECRLETGRTHQIRIHLAEAGSPVLGERVYGKRRAEARAEAPRVMLHAVELGFRHPQTGEPMRFEEPPPADFARVLADRSLGRR